MGNDDSLGATIQGTVDQRLVIFVNTHDRSHTPDITGSGEISKIGRVDGSMLSFQPDPVETDGSDGINIIGMGESGDNVSIFTSGEFFFHPVRP